MKKNLFFSLLASVVMTEYSSAITYIESTDLATGFYRIILNTGGSLLKMSTHTSIQSADAGALAYVGMEYKDIDFIGTQGNGTNQKFTAFLSNEGNFIGLNISSGIAKSYVATETSTGVSFSTISWLGSASLGTTTDITDAGNIGFYQNSNGSFNLVALGSGNLTALTRTETVAGKSFNDINWIGFQGAAVGLPTPTYYYQGAYFDPSAASGAGAMILVDLNSGAETVLGASQVVNASPTLSGLSYADIPWLDTNSSAFNIPAIATGSEGTFYVVNVPEPTSGMLLTMAGIVAVFHRRRNGKSKLIA